MRLRAQRSRWLRSPLMRRRCPCSLGGCGPPARCPGPYGPRSGSSPGGHGAGTRRGPKAPTPGPIAPGPIGPSQKRYVGRCFPCPPPLWVGGLRSLFRLFPSCRAGAPAPALGRSGGGPRPRCRGGGPSFSPSLRSPPPGRSLSPRRLRSGRVRRCAAPWPLAAVPALCLPLGSLRASVVALAALGVAFALRAVLPGPPLVAPSGFGPGASSPGAAAALPPCFGSAPGSLFARVLRPLRCPVSGFLPCAPPVPAAPAGGSGEASGPFGWACGPPAFGGSPRGRCQAMRLPIVAAPARVRPCALRSQRRRRCGARAPLPSPLRYIWRRA